MLLQNESNTVSGIALDPVRGKNGEPGVFESAELSQQMVRLGGQDVRLDIRDHATLQNTIAEIKPDVVIHLAAQPLVRESYTDPRTTFESNIIGTYNVMEAVEWVSQNVHKIKAQLIITTDKVYKNYNRHDGYKESDEVGANPDPYSSSKAAADIVAQCMLMHPDHKVPTAIARGGNVIGGGDVSAERLVVDLIADAKHGAQTHLRFPDATRPWQHVLDCLDGYLTVVDGLLTRPTEIAGQAFNIAPDATDLVRVGDLATEFVGSWNDEIEKLAADRQNLSEISVKPAKQWANDSDNHPHEANLLSLDPAKTAEILKWQGNYHWKTAILKTVQWEQAVTQNQSAFEITSGQITEYYTAKTLGKGAK